jgi:methylmalonyl-CoA/ethylmalonyl-CoA epimerase
MKIIGVDHIGIAVNNIEKAFEAYRQGFGLELEGIEQIKDRNLRIGFLDMGNTHIELIEPTSIDSTIAKFIESRGEGLHHYCIRVDNINEALTHFNNFGYELIDKVPREGAAGSKIAFIHPKSFGGVLIELKEIH